MSLRRLIAKLHRTPSAPRIDLYGMLQLHDSESDEGTCPPLLRRSCSSTDQPRLHRQNAVPRLNLAGVNNASGNEAAPPPLRRRSANDHIDELWADGVHTPQPRLHRQNAVPRLNLAGVDNAAGNEGAPPPLRRRSANDHIDEPPAPRRRIRERRNAIVEVPAQIPERLHLRNEDMVPTRVLCERASDTLEREGNNICCICTERMAVCDRIACVPCGGWHKLHSACLQKWWSSSSHGEPTCPLCRWSLPQASDGPDSTGLVTAVQHAQAELARLSGSAELLP